MKSDCKSDKKSKKGMGCFMLGVVALAALLGVTNVLDCSETESSTVASTNIMDKAGKLFKDMAGKMGSLLCPMKGCKPQTNDVPEKAADSAKAIDVLTCICYAAEIFSIRVGGGGEELFPTNAFQMKDNMPPAVAKSIEGCFSAPVAPLGGYVCQYMVDPTRTNFLCKVTPANGYTGAVFVVQKDKKIVHVGDVTCISTNSVSQKSK